MNYEEMSDFEINKRVAECRFKECIELEVFSEHDNSDKVIIVSQGLVVDVFDFNNPADAWLIITEMMNDSYIFTISDVAILWHGESDSDDVIIECEYPLRAFMICYLMMKEGK